MTRRAVGFARFFKVNLVGILGLFAVESICFSSAFVVSKPLASSERALRQNLAALTATRLPGRVITAHDRAASLAPARKSLLVRLLSSSIHRRDLPELKHAAGRVEVANVRSGASAGAADTPPVEKMEVVLSPGDGVGGEGLHWAPSNANGALIFMHGLGDTAGGWSDLLQLFEAAQIHQNTRLILPTASTRPVTLNMGVRMTAWSDIRGLSPDAIEDEAGLMDSKARIDKIIDSQIEAGIDPSRILVGGFSQGGAVAYLVCLTSPHKLGGILAMSSWCPLGKVIEVSPHYVEAVPRIMHCHGAVDDMVRPVYGQTSVESVRNRLIDAGARPEKCQEDITFKLYPGLGHFANQQELNDIKAFLSRTFGSQ
ncbi:phospholipase/carboxylesterase, putative [Eimeria maxima]|uniref:Phospholipase/carboxylesterase, putative n=1 Tax=Eimeria maxima TaxID=5804 RepID=U6MF57_EIMMA|nr:phospholipase/carboxylesterase, putative [Eimeria maxima]CDJ61074.1 phospholipase/carboxylesterase, putative [Eimeria maxima]